MQDLSARHEHIVRSRYPISLIRNTSSPAHRWNQPRCKHETAPSMHDLYSRSAFFPNANARTFVSCADALDASGFKELAKRF